MGCRAEQHRRLQSARHALLDCDAVTDATVIAADEPVGKPTIDVVLAPNSCGLASPIEATAATDGPMIRRVQRQGAHWQALMVA
jgi:hypothetical protein